MGYWTDFVLVEKNYFEGIFKKKPKSFRLQAKYRQFYMELGYLFDDTDEYDDVDTENMDWDEESKIFDKKFLNTPIWQLMKKYSFERIFCMLFFNVNVEQTGFSYKSGSAEHIFKGVLPAAYKRRLINKKPLKALNDLLTLNINKSKYPYSFICSKGIKINKDGYAGGIAGYISFIDTSATMCLVKTLKKAYEENWSIENKHLSKHWFWENEKDRKGVSYFKDVMGKDKDFLRFINNKYKKPIMYWFAPEN